MTPSTARALRLGASVAFIGAVACGGAWVLVSVKAACEEPLLYRIESVDPRFNMSREELELVLHDAAAIWNTEAGKTVLLYDPEGDLPVSLVFDERQAAHELGQTIDTDQAAYERKRESVDKLVEEHEAAANRHDAQVAAFARDEAAYAAEVEKWNRQGGAPSGEYEKLESTRRALARRQSALNDRASELNAMADRLNTEVGELNALAQHINEKVGVFNESAGTEFDQGQYVEDKNGKRITIYEFENRGHLARALAHEFGHALGIGHTEDPQSLMYPYNSGNELSLREEDIAQLRNVCELP